MPEKDREKMVLLLEKSGIKLKKDQMIKLWKYHNLIQKRNQEYSLTGIRDFNEIILKHYVDCFILDKLIAIPFPLLDIGTGAGFPGIPLKILFADEKVILAEPRKERVRFLYEAMEILDFKNTYIYPHKISRNFDVRVKAVITRALEPISKTLQRVSSCLEIGGIAIFMKGPSIDLEIKNFKNKFSKKYTILKNYAYVLPLINHERRLVVLQRLI